MKIYLIGGWNKTRMLAKSLLKRGHRVIVINENPEHCREFSLMDEKLVVYLGDGSKPYVLEESNIYNADIAVALTDSDEDNLVISELAKKRFKVKKTVSLVSDPVKTDFFKKMGVDSVMCAVNSISSIIERQVLMNELSTNLPVGEGSVEITQITIPNKGQVVGKTLMEIKLPREVVVSCIMRSTKAIIPRGDTVLLAGDVVVLVSGMGKHAKAGRILSDI